jgi:hypothetical protein
VTALNNSGNLDTAYSGTVHFTSSDPQATLPANTTLTNGVGTLPVTLRTAGVQTILAVDTANSQIAGGSNHISVLPGPAARLAVSAPASAVLNTPFTFTVSALDFDVDRQAVLRDRGRGLSLTDIARAHRISRASVSRIIKEAA